MSQKTAILDWLKREPITAIQALAHIRCKCCGNTRYSIQGRKKLAGGGWRCAECAK